MLWNDFAYIYQQFFHNLRLKQAVVRRIMFDLFPHDTALSQTAVKSIGSYGIPQKLTTTFLADSPRPVPP